MFLMTSKRPDLAYSVGYLSQQQTMSSKKKVCSEWHSIITSIVYKPVCSPGTIVCYSNADFESCRTTAEHSTFGLVVSHVGGAISWLRQRQAMVAMSTTESEIATATEAAKSYLDEAVVQ